MRILLAVAASLLLIVTFAHPIQAQEVEPTHSVVRFFKCSPESTGVEWLRRMRPVIEEMMAEGHFLDHGILRHAWGDEWNVVDYFIVSDLSRFFSSFAEMGRRLTPVSERILEEEELPPWNQVCREHKDVIYRIVPPAG